MTALPVRFAAILSIIPALLVGGCTTVVRGGPASSSNGVHYSLPQPLLIVTPGVDGTITVTQESIPDPNHEYTVSASSVFGKYTFEAKVANGLLTDLNMNSDASVTEKALVDAASAVEKAKLTADKKAVDAAAAAVKAREDAINAATKLVLDKKRALAKLQDERAELIRQGAIETSDSVKAEDLKIVSAQLDLKYSEDDLAALLDASAASDGGNRDAGNRDKGGAESPTAMLAWGPVVYRIEQSIAADGLPTVRLVQSTWNRTGTAPESKPQLQFRTAETGKPPRAPAPDVRFTPEGPGVVTPVKGKLELVLNVSTAIYSAGNGHVIDTNQTAVGDATVALQSSFDKLIVTLPSGLKAGIYVLEFDYRQGKTSTTETVHWQFTVSK